MTCSHLAAGEVGLDVPGNASRWLVPNLDAAAALWNLYDTNVFRLSTGPALGNNASVTEESTAGFFQTDFTLPDAPVRGNIGVRYVKTDQTSSGFTFKPAILDNPATRQRVDPHRTCSMVGELKVISESNRLRRLC